ncbi:zinc finger MYM-type protein 3-like [Protopterus annectens]|uniref:zinc finger MYM-type protein 3-like n=1 Tax=Protopterus annectens TaxID=7888 RepID=UPI001CFC3550|nr:zinc finger MYM-type protein 3-like [Protopterus annectens]
MAAAVLSKLLAEQQMFTLEKENQQTLKKTKNDIRTVEKYMHKKKEQRALEEIPPSELDLLLADFIHVLKRQDGTEYEPSTLRGILGSVDRHLMKQSYGHYIFHGNKTYFQETLKALKTKQKALRRQGKGRKPNKAELLTEADIVKLYSSGALGMNNPASLLHMMYFNIGMHFGLRTSEHYTLQWGDLQLRVDSSGQRYLEYERQTESRNKNVSKDVRLLNNGMYENKVNPERDPIRAYLQYASQRPKKMISPNAPFYLAPNTNYLPERPYSLWYRSMVVGKNKLRSLMRDIKVAAGLPEHKKITNHSTRKMCIQRLIERNVIPTETIHATVEDNPAFTNSDYESKPLQNNDILVLEVSEENYPSTSKLERDPLTQTAKNSSFISESHSISRQTINTPVLNTPPPQQKEM